MTEIFPFVSVKTCGCEFKILSRVEGRGSRVKCRGSRVKCRGSRVKCRGSRVKCRGSRVKCRGFNFLLKITKLVYLLK